MSIRDDIGRVIKTAKKGSKEAAEMKQLRKMEMWEVVERAKLVAQRIKENERNT